jgi:hypothetical protein
MKQMGKAKWRSQGLIGDWRLETGDWGLETADCGLRKGSAKKKA